MKILSGREHASGAGLEGYLTVVAIKNAGPLRHQRFAVGQNKAMADLVAQWASEHKQGVFYCPAIFKTSGNGRSWGDIDDVVESLALVVDEDADTSKCARLVMPPTVRICTSSEPVKNWHHFYLWNPNNRPPIDDAIRIGRLLREVSGADSTTGTVPHLYRYPGTLNWPTDTKISRGRPLHPQPTTLHLMGGVIDPSELERGLLDFQRTGGTGRHTTDGKSIVPSVKTALASHDLNGDRSRLPGERSL
jgi:hypothetical protein